METSKNIQINSADQRINVDVWNGDASVKGSILQVWLTTSFLVHSRGSLLALLKTLAADSINLWITSAGMFEVAAAKTSWTASSLSRISVAPLAGMAMTRLRWHVSSFVLSFSFLLFSVKINVEVSVLNKRPFRFHDFKPGVFCQCLLLLSKNRWK